MKCGRREIHSRLRRSRNFLAGFGREDNGSAAHSPALGSRQLRRLGLWLAIILSILWDCLPRGNQTSMTERDTEAFVVTHLSVMKLLIPKVEKLSNY